MTTGYSREQRRALTAALQRGDRPVCPACGAVLDRREIPPRPELPYVRRRVWLLCPACKRTAALDLRPGGKA